MMVTNYNLKTSYVKVKLKYYYANLVIEYKFKNILC